MAKKTKTSASNTAYFKLYKAENRFLRNQLRKVARHVKKHPNDLVASGVLSKLK